MHWKFLGTLIALTLLPETGYGQLKPPPGSPTPGQIPSRDTANRAATGKARIQGRVIAADTGNPLRGALVQVTASEVQVRRAATTDAEGRYEVDALPAARYTLSVSKGGYVTLQFGQQRPFEQGRTLELSDTQVADRIDFALPRGGVITGRIVDSFGDPIAGVRVDARRYQYLPGGQRQLVPAVFGAIVERRSRTLSYLRSHAWHVCGRGRTRSQLDNRHAGTWRCDDIGQCECRLRHYVLSGHGSR